MVLHWLPSSSYKSAQRAAESDPINYPASSLIPGLVTATAPTPSTLLNSTLPLKEVTIFAFLTIKKQIRLYVSMFAHSLTLSVFFSPRFSHQICTGWDVSNPTPFHLSTRHINITRIRLLYVVRCKLYVYEHQTPMMSLMLTPSRSLSSHHHHRHRHCCHHHRHHVPHCSPSLSLHVEHDSLRWGFWSRTRRLFCNIYSLSVMLAHWEHTSVVSCTDPPTAKQLELSQLGKERKFHKKINFRTLPQQRVALNQCCSADMVR